MKDFRASNNPDPRSPGPDVTESRKSARWVPPLIAIIILIVVLVVLGVYYF